MQGQPYARRKVWPVGVVDNGDTDARVTVPAGVHFAEDAQLEKQGIPYPVIMQEQPYPAMVSREPTSHGLHGLPVLKQQAPIDFRR